MNETASLTIKVDSSGADRATRSLDKLDRAAGGSERAASKLGKAWGVAIGLISSAVIVGATTAFIRQADAFANMSAKLDLVSKSGADAVKVQRALFDLAQKTSSDLEGVTDLYVKLAQSSEDLAGNSELLLSVTERVSKALVISGTDAAGAASVIRQFSQAMGAGALRGDEFISIMENAPRVARAIADGLKVPIGALRDMAAQGKLTADVVIKALEDQGAKIDEEFGRMPITVSRATQQVENALLQMIGVTDQAEGASADLALAIKRLADQMSDPEFQAGFQTLVGGLVDTVTWATKAASAVGNLVGKYNDWLASKGFSPAEADSTPQELQARRDKLVTAADRASGSVGAAVFGEGTADKLRAEIAMIDRLMGKQQEAQSYLNLPEYLGGTQGEPFSAVGAMPFSAIGDMPKSRATTGGGNSGGGGAKAATTATQELTEAEKAWREVMETNAAIDREVDSFRQQSVATDYAKAVAIDEGIAATDGLIEAMEFERSIIGLNNADREKAIALRYADANATAEQIARIGELAVATENAREQQQFADETQRSLTNAVVDYASGAKSATEAFGDFADQLFARALEFVADKAIQAMFDAFNGNGKGASSGSNGGGTDWAGIFGSILGAFGGGSAKGNVFSGGSMVTAFANGGIVGGPALFPMSGNRTGLMGEAGPEAIMPLSRGRDGKLGVAGSGGNTTNISINVPNIVQYRTAAQIAQEAGEAQQRAQARNR